MSLLERIVKKITKTFEFMEFPLSMSRQGDFPLDKSSLWWDLEEATNYAKNDPTAYPGQPITVVNETENSVTLFVIGTDGSLVAQGGMASVDALKNELKAHKADYDKLKAAYEETMSRTGEEEEFGQEEYLLYGSYEPLTVTITHILNNK